ncbi:hypothetical protein F7725_027219 [Dissostichus mawsoni]|uniref:Uncharacterized protein n=1 Tax=Dissostichus mawsoni TaxID=36200 RepID=A0A7J5XCI4_DISMA|nr:hypothetical protein F7725_027219 [Dissostichus mawsoni]
MASGQDLCRMDLDIKWWKKKSELGTSSDPLLEQEVVMMHEVLGGQTKERACQTEHGTLMDMKERPSSVRLNTGQAPSGSALGSASPGEAPPLQDQDLLWDQPHQVLSFRDIKAVSVEIKIPTRDLWAGFPQDYMSLVHQWYCSLGQCCDSGDCRGQLRESIRDLVLRCPQTLFIFDEAEKLHPGLIDAIKPFMDHYDNVDGVNYRRALFLFLRWKKKSLSWEPPQILCWRRPDLQEQEVVMMHEVLGGQKDKLRKQTGSTPCEGKSCQTEHGTLMDMKERPSSVRLNTGQAPSGSALGSASPGEAPPFRTRICSGISLIRC